MSAYGEGCDELCSPVLYVYDDDAVPNPGKSRHVPSP